MSLVIFIVDDLCRVVTWGTGDSKLLKKTKVSLLACTSVFEKKTVVLICQNKYYCNEKILPKVNAVAMVK